FTVSNIAVSPQSLQFSYQLGGTLPAAQALTLTGQATTFTAVASSTSGDWLQVGPSSGSSPTTIVASLNPVVIAALAAGTYHGSITITPASGTANTPITVGVTLTVTAAPSISVNPSSLV